MASGDVSNVKIEPCDLEWGNPETTGWTAVADVTDSLDGTFFNLVATGGAKFHVWFNTSGGPAVDPAPVSSTPLEVAVTTDDTAATIAGLTVAIIEADGSFNSKIDPCDATKFIVQNVDVGVAGASTDGSAPSGFGLEILRTGSSFLIGLIDGDVDISATEDMFDVIAQQTGTQIVDKIRTGNTVENIAVAMKESSAAKIKVILEAGGSSVTPGGGSEVTGWGETKRFLNISNDTRQLIFHPVRNVAANRANDWAFWRAYPNLTGFNFSGETDQLISVEFTIIPDPLVQNELNQFVYADHQQNFLK